MQSEIKERFYQHIFETIGDGLILNDVETGLVIEANPAASTLHGYDHEDFIGLPLTAFIRPDSYAQFARMAAKVHPGGLVAATMVHVRQDESLITVEVRGTGCMVQGRLCVLSVISDVSLRVQNEQQLREQVKARTREQSTLAHFLRTLLHNPATCLLEGVRAWMWVPLTAKGHLIGMMGIAHAESDAFTSHQANLALTLANQAAITLVNARLYEQAQTLAKLQERQRLAQNLHDAVNQSLFSASLIAEVLPRLWARNPEEGQKSLEDLRRLTRGALAEMRSLLAELRPLVLTDSELDDLPYQLSDALTGRTNIPVAINVAGKGTLPGDVQVALYRLCQEGLTNVAKHAGASQVTIDQEFEDRKVEIHIRDDGCGFNPDHVPSGHHGLSIMRERARDIGADLLVASRPDHGTEIIIRWMATLEREVL